MSDTNKVLDCGHVWSGPTHFAAGRNIRGVQVSVCADCANAYERLELKAAHANGERFTAYLAAGGAELHTWLGSVLGRVIRSRVVKLTRLSHTHGKAICSVRVRDVHGNEWVGRGNDGIVITLRPVKKS